MSVGWRTRRVVVSRSPFPLSTRDATMQEQEQATTTAMTMTMDTESHSHNLHHQHTLPAKPDRSKHDTVRGRYRALQKKHADLEQVCMVGSDDSCIAA